MKLQITVSRASLIFQKRFPDFVSSYRTIIASAPCTRSNIANTKQKKITEWLFTVNCHWPKTLKWLFTVNCHKPKNIKLAIYSQLSLAKNRLNGYLQSKLYNSTCLLRNVFFIKFGDEPYFSLAQIY